MVTKKSKLRKALTLTGVYAVAFDPKAYKEVACDGVKSSAIGIYVNVIFYLGMQQPVQVEVVG